VETPKKPTQEQRILVVDDDPALRRLVGDRLEHAGYQVVSAGSGHEALSLLDESGLPHLAIVDIMMPGMTGFDFCRIVQNYSDLPIIFLTAVDQEETVIQGLEQYAEDYVTKPFSPRELVARVRRVLRRMGDFNYANERLVQIDDGLAIDFVHQQAFVNQKLISLTPIETKLLYILTRNAGRTMNTDFLLRRLWPLEEVYEDTLRVHIHRLRQKIEANPAKPRYVLTKRGSGYFFPAHLQPAVNANDAVD
jgi:DNA-binding response OmpR family regulator